MIENRRDYRIPFRKPVLISTPQRIISGISENLSMGGMAVSCLEAFDLDQSCRVFFQIQNENSPVIYNAIVKRIKPPSSNPEVIPGMALQFIRTSSESIESLRQYLERTHQSLKVASALLSSAEPDIISIQELVKNLHIPPYNDLGELKFYVERVLKSIELTQSKIRPSTV